MNSKKLYIIGAGSVGGHVALNIKEYAKNYTIAGFFDDDSAKIGTRPFGSEVIGKIDEALNLHNAGLVIGIAFPNVKRKILERLSANNSLRYPTLIHERAWVSREVSMGKGCIIYPGTTINFGSEIEDFVVLNANCSLGHNTRVGAYSSVAPGVSTGGHTTFEKGVDVGIGASTIQNMAIGAGSVVGGQSMIVKNVNAGSTVAGVPAQSLREKK